MKEKRNTMQKELTYDAVLHYPGHPSADDVYQVISSKYKSISKATVYRNLASLYSDGKIGRVIPTDGWEARFDHRTDKHSHAVCKSCGRVFDVDVSYDSAALDKAVCMEDGFEITSHELIFEGICKDCREKEKENEKWN